MTQLIFHSNHNNLPPASDTVLPVQMYGLDGQGRGDISIIGSPVLEKLKRLGVRIPIPAMDFLSIALAVTAADTFVRRSDASDGWTRQLAIQLPLHEPERWNPLKKQLEKAFHFLSGDMWEFDFVEGGCPPPNPYRLSERFKLLKLRGLDCVCLFSGGLDSAIGAIDLIAEGRSPLLVSHAYKGDKTHQDEIAANLLGRYSRFAVNAHPVSANGETDITMRTRSVNFLAFGALGACAVRVINQLDKIDLIVPENGFISLNAPLTLRRIGSLSTRTTHPYFIESIQDIFDSAGIPCTVHNPYQFKTKGEMVFNCKNGQLLASIVDNTVSCSHWKRSNQQCGVCVPCIIRRSALRAGSLQEQIEYSFNDVADVLNEPDRRDDLLALSIAIAQKSSRKIGLWISDSGPLPPSQFREFQKVFSRGLDEVELYLKAEGVL
jgi:hypothetical protein